LTSAAPSLQSPAQQPATIDDQKVRGQAFVFAKGILEDAGFAWRVRGDVGGFAANLVATQFPAPGTRLLDTGAPVITLRLDRNAKYAEDGIPENFSPYLGTRLLRPSAAKAAAAKRPAVKPPAVKRPAAKPKVAPKPAVKRPTPVAKKPAVMRPKPKAQPKKAVRTKVTRPKPKAVRSKPRPQVKRTAARPEAFSVPGAPKEPLNEMPLPRRAHALGAWLTKHPRPTDANVDHWLYQHAWIVTGAKFGWWRGAEALRILIAVDNRVIRNWGIGTRSRATARAALAEVKARKR
jgi:hypothetical protein